MIGVLSYLGYTIPHWLVWSLIALALFASAFHAYRKQRRSTVIDKIDLEFPILLASLTGCLAIVLLLVKIEFFSPLEKYFKQPNFSTDQIMLGISDEVPNPNHHSITFNLTIFNDGSPSVVRGWHLTIHGTEKDIEVQTVVNFPYEWQTNWANGATSPTLVPTKDSFTGTMNDVPIPRGGQRSGFITFLVSDISRAYLQSPTTKYELAFWDVTGKKYDYPNICVPPPSSKQ